MRSLHIKLWRDLIWMRGQATAILLVMACGVATFVMSLSLLDSLTGTLDRYYERNRFAHVFAPLVRAPNALVDRLAEIPGVGHAQTRVVERVTLDMPDMTEPASGQIISLPRDAGAGLNLLYLRSGRFPEGNRSREVLVSQRFAEAHELHPGDTVEAILNGRLESLRVVGVALSPEYIYLLGPGSILPEKKRFGVFWMGRDEMEAAFDMDGAFNDAVLSLMPGANAAEVIDRVDDLTARYGGLGAYERADQTSHSFVTNEIRELRGMAMIMPTIFLAVAAFLFNIVLGRMVAAQREQIASLKALGYTRGELGRHYLGFVMIIALLGVALGTAGGMAMGRGVTAMYSEFFDFPSFDYILRPMVVVLGAGVSVGAAGLGVAYALYSAMRLPPAEAMRPQAPVSFRPTFLERLGVHSAVPAVVRMILRQLERRPLKTLLSIFGMALATSIVVVGAFTEDAVEYVIDFQYHRVQQYDVDVALYEQADKSALSSIRHMPGVRAIEPYRAVPVRIRNAQRSRRTAINGLDRGDGLYRLMDLNGNAVPLPPEGIVLSRMLAESLELEPGELVTIEAMEGRRPVFHVPVAGLIDDFSGLAAYMDLGALNRAMREAHSIGGVYLTVDPLHVETLYHELLEAPRVAAVHVKATTVENFRETIAKSMGMMRPFLIGFAVIIACGVVYNSARISLAERSRDLATLRVLGFSRHEVSAIQLGELTIVTAIAIPVGLLLGHGLAWLASSGTGSELFRIPFIIEPSTYALAALVVLAASVGSGLIVQRHLDRLDLIAVLKARE